MYSHNLALGMTGSEAVLDRANELGVKILNTARFLEMFGLEENYFDADHLVTPTP